jgi:hypothetical protein
MSKKAWIFTDARKRALRKAQKEHVRLVQLGKRASGK